MNSARLFFWIIMLLTISAILFFGFRDFLFQRNLESDKKSTKIETLYIPGERAQNSAGGIQIKLSIERRFLAQRSWVWNPPIKSQVNFAINLETMEPTIEAPVDDPSVVIILLGVTRYDALAVRLDPNHDWFRPVDEFIYKNMRGSKYGLSYSINYLFIENKAPFDEYYFDSSRYTIKIVCHDNGSVYPDLCKMEYIGKRGGGVVANSDRATSTEIWFRNERIAEWRSIKSKVDEFLKDKVETVSFRSHAERKKHMAKDTFRSKVTVY